MREFGLYCSFVSLVAAFITAFVYIKKREKLALYAGFTSVVMGLTALVASMAMLGGIIR